jgi:hypothetical protein
MCSTEQCPITRASSYPLILVRRQRSIGPTGVEYLTVPHFLFILVKCLRVWQEPTRDKLIPLLMQPLVFSSQSNISNKERTYKSRAPFIEWSNWNAYSLNFIL